MTKTGQEQFTNHGSPIGVSVLDFWRFSYSELNSDPRDDIAEYLVAHALGITSPYNKRNWTLYDINYNERPVEVKSTSYFQTWRTDSGISQNRTFSIRESKAEGAATAKRHSEVYVFCLLNGNTEIESDPLKLENWDFYVVPTSVINEKCGHNKTISLKRIEKLGYAKIPYANLKEAIDTALPDKR